MKKLFLKSLALLMMLMMSVSMWATDYCGELVQSTVDNTTVGIGVTIKRVSGTNKLLMQFESDKISGVRAGGTFQQWGNGVWANQADAVANFASGWTQTGNVFSKEFEFSTFPTAGNGQIYALFDLQNAGAPPVAGFTLTNINFEPECVVAPVASTWEAADVNVAKDAPVFISARWNGDKAKAVDDIVDEDNIQLQVTVAQPTEWLVLDLGANVDIEKFSLTTRGDRKDKKFAICTASAQATAPEFADGTDVLAGVWKEEWIFDEEYENTGRTTLTYSVEWKNVRYIKYQATERNHGDQYGTSICEFRVKCAATKAVTGVTLDQTTASVPANKTLTLKATVAPADAADKSVTWLSSKPEVATVTDGVVTPVAEGTTTITVKTNDGDHTATCEVTILPALATAPTTAAPVPTVDAAKVMSIYSDSYTPCVTIADMNNLNLGWWDNPTMVQEEIEGNHMLHYYGRMTGMIGWEHAHVNIGTMNKVHVDIWAQEDGTLTMGPTSADPTVVAEKVLTLVGQQWNSFDLDLTTDFSKTLDLSNMFQNQFTKYSAQENLFVDNYFYYTTLDIDTEVPVMTDASLASTSFTSAVLNVAATDNRGVTKYIVKNGSDELGKYTAADGKITITGLTDGTAYTLSIYAQDAAENVSDNKVDVELTTLALPDAAPAPVVTNKEYVSVYAPSLTNMLAHDFVLANWGSVAGTKMADKGYIFYHTANNASVVWGENNAGGNAIVAADAYKGDKGGLDASAMEYMHVDIWADKAGCNSMVVVIDDRAYNAVQTLNAGWNSFDLAMSNFAWTSNPTDYNADNVAWIKFNGLNNTNDVAITNVYFWKASADAPKQVSATVNIAEAGTAVVKQNGVEVAQVENGSNVDFIAEANDGYLFLGWYNGADLVSTNVTYTVEDVQAKVSLQARFRALNTIYCHTELTSTVGDKVIYLTMKRTAENQYQVIIDSEEEMNGFSNAYIGKINGDSEIRLNDAAGGKQNVTVSDNKHRLTVDVTSTTPIRWNSPAYINMPGEFTFTAPNHQVIEYDVTCEPATVESVTLNQTSATIDVDGTITLAASASPIYADNQTATWTSNNETVATVADGVVTGHAEGDAIITATIGGKSATCAVTVALDATVPHVAAPAVDATGKVIRAIYSDDVDLAITNAEFGLNVYGNAPYEKKVIEGNNFLLYTATEAQQVISWGSTNGAGNALLGKEGMTNPDNTGDKGLYAADMKYLHIDIWSSEAATNFHIQRDNDIICMVNLDGSGWQSFDIDVTDKQNLLKNISILKFANTPRNTKVALDNLYFWKLEDVHATGVSLDKTATSIVEGAQETLVATVAPANATLTACTWESNNTAVATVANGVVTAVAPGEATITVTTVDGGFTATCVVTVTADMTRPQEAAPAVVTDGVEIRAIYTDDVELAIAHNFGFNPWGGAPVSKQVVEANNYLLIDAATANNMAMGMNDNGANAIIAKDGMSDPDNTDNKGLYVAGMTHCHIDIWSKVAKTGVKVLINDHALTSINLTEEGWQSFDIELVDADKTAAANVRWMKVIDLPTGTKVAIDNLYFWKSNGTAAVTGVSLNKSEATIDINETLTLIATVEPAAAGNKNIIWSSSADAVATVEDGVVTGVAEGDAVITAKTEDGGFLATCNIHVVAPTAKTWYGYAEKNDLGFEYAITYNVDKTVTITITRYGNKTGIVAPSFSIDGEWKDCVKDGDVWTRTTTKTFTKGQTVSCFIQNNYAGGQSDPHFSYTVGSENEKPAIEVTGVQIAQETLELAINETYTLSATVLPMAATDKTITWSSDNTEAATVDATGKVTAVAAGTAHITATHGLFSATCTVTVIAELTSVTYWNDGENNNVKVIYEITRNANRTLTYMVQVAGFKTGINVQVNDGYIDEVVREYHNTTLVDGKYTYTTPNTYTDGATVNGYFWLPYEGGVARINYVYAVGTASTEDTPLIYAVDERENKDATVLKSIDGQTTNLVINRTFAGNDYWNTLCLPFDMSAEQIEATFGVGAEVCTLADARMKSADEMYIRYEHVSDIQAGRPYLIKTTAGLPSLFFENITVDANAETTAQVGGIIEMVGTFYKSTIPAGQDYLYLDAADGYLHCYGEALAIKAFRCYYHFVGEAATAVAGGAPLRARVIVGEQVTTDMETISETVVAEKVLRDGQMVIIRADREYNAQGQLIY